MTMTIDQMASKLIEEAACADYRPGTTHERVAELLREFTAITEIEPLAPIGLQRAAIRFAVECLRNGPPPGSANAVSYNDAIAALERWEEPFPTDVPSKTRDVEERLRSLRAASRPTEPLTDQRGATAQGHITSAITQLERRREELHRSKK